MTNFYVLIHVYFNEWTFDKSANELPETQLFRGYAQTWTILKKVRLIWTGNAYEGSRLMC